MNLFKKNKKGWINNLNVRARTIKLLEGSVSMTLFNWIRRCFLSYSPKTLTTKGKADRLDVIKIKSFCASKDILKNIRQLSKWNKIFAN